MPERFAGGFDSPASLTEEVLRCLAQENIDQPKRLPLSRDEFERWVWPELPASRPESGFKLFSVVNR